MDFFNQAVAQVRELFLSMNPAARITSALLLGVIVVSLGYLVQMHGGGADEYLFNGEFLQPREAGRVEAAIAQAGLSGYDRVGNRFKVPRGQKAAYLAAVADAGALPTNFDTLLTETLDSSPLLSDATRKQQWKAARERQLSMIVQMMSGVEDAKVLYDIRPARGFEKEQITATVSVMPEPGSEFGAMHTGNIRKAVAGAIAGLSPENVQIFNLSDGSQISGGGGPDGANFDDEYYQTRVAYEQRMKSSIEKLLMIPGARIEVAAELDKALSKDSRTISTNGEGAAVRSTKNEEKTSNDRTEDRGAVGLRAQGPSRNGQQQSVAKSNQLIETLQEDTESFIPTTEEVLTEAGLTPERVRVSVAVPTAYLEQVWRERNPDKPAEERPKKDDIDLVKGDVEQEVQKAVLPLLPKQIGEEVNPNVAVTFFQSFAPEALEPPSMASTALLWAGGNMSTLLMAGLAVVALLMLRSIVKSIPAAEPIAAFGMPALALDAGGARPAASGPRGVVGGDELEDRPKLKLKKGSSVKEDIAEVVREDPDAAAAILRSWIGNAG
ncbi:MAG: hypothetical protein CMJ58_24165 [Planctomycetaceae bacterium]|nr:hypothetical protein [Planctomycetaceae bacterium]